MRQQSRPRRKARSGSVSGLAKTAVDRVHELEAETKALEKSVDDLHVTADQVHRIADELGEQATKPRKIRKKKSKP
jgi:phage shock protein A